MTETASNTHKIAGYSTINMVGQGLRIFLSFLATVFVSRWLGAKGFGEINLILGYTIYLGWFLTFGFEHSLPFYCSTLSEPKKDGTPESVLLAGVVNTIVGGGITLWVVNYYLPDLLLLSSLEHLLLPARLLCFQTLIIALGSVFAGYLRGVKSFLPVIIREQFSFGILHFVGVVFFIKILGLDVLGYSISYAVATCIGFLILLAALLKKVKKDALIRVSFSQWRSWSLFSFPLGVMGTLEPLLNWSSILLVGYFLTATEAGQFSLAARLAFFIQFIFVALQPIFSPFIGDLLKSGKTIESQQLLGTVCYWSAKWSLLFGFFLIHSTPFILSIFGDSYSGADLCLYILIPGFVFEGLFGPIKQTFIMAGHSRISLVNLTLSLVFNILLSFYLIPKMGIAGGALSFSVTYMVLNLLRVVQVYYYFKILPFNRRQVRNLTIIVIGLAVLSGARIFTLSSIAWCGLALIVFLAGIIVLYWKDRGLFVYWMGKRKQKE